MHYHHPPLPKDPMTNNQQAKEEILDSCYSAVSMFQAWSDTFSDDAWDKLMEDKQTENLMDALCELEFQLENRDK